MMQNDSDLEKDNNGNRSNQIRCVVQDRQCLRFKSNFLIFLIFNGSEIKPEVEPLSWKFWRKRRYIVVLMAFCGFFNVYSLRVNLSVGIVAMTENRTVHYANGTIGYVCIMWYRQFSPSSDNSLNYFRFI